jgi:hypothetical protein
MEAAKTGKPYLATLRISLGFPPLAQVQPAQLWDDLMEMLLQHPRIIDPVISNDLDSREVGISFEFEATGNAHEDGFRALALLSEATRTTAPASPFDWERWLGEPSSAGTVQYPVHA